MRLTLYGIQVFLDWSIGDICWVSTSSVKFYKNNTPLNEHNTNIPNEAIPLTLRTAGSGSVYADYVAVRVYTATEPAFSSFSAEQTVPSSDISSPGQPIQEINLLSYNATSGHIEDTYDFVNDTAHYHEIFNTSGWTGDGWKANGAPSITCNENSSTWYMVIRERINNTVRGKYLSCHYNNESVTDRNDWHELWRVDKTNITGITINSFEKATIRYWNNSFYLYFCYDDGTWHTAYVKSSDINQLDDQLLSYSQRSTIIAHITS